MRKKGMALLLGLVLTLGMSVSVFAEDTPGVSLNSKGQLVYSEGNVTEDGTYLGNTLSNIAPGETKTEVIQISNEYKNTVSFYLKENTLKAMEDAATNSGGAYNVVIKVGEDEDSAYTLLDTLAGGYTSQTDASTSGLKDVTELKDYTYLTKLSKGDSTNLYITVNINGEAYDMDYADAVALLGFDFRAYYKDPAGPTIASYTINKTKDVVTVETVTDPSQGKAAQTGDTTGNLLPILAVIFCGCGVVVLLVAMKKRKAVQ